MWSAEAIAWTCCGLKTMRLCGWVPPVLQVTGLWGMGNGVCEGVVWAPPPSSTQMSVQGCTLSARCASYHMYPTCGMRSEVCSCTFESAGCAVRAFELCRVVCGACVLVAHMSYDILYLYLVSVPPIS